MQNLVLARPWQVRQTTLELNLDHLKKNIEVIAKRAPNAEILALLKSDAYGHSHQIISKFLDSLGPESKINGFGVATVEEGIELRREGVRKSIYVMSGVQHLDKDLFKCIETCNLTPVISSLTVLSDFVEFSKSAARKCTIHLKFNTGMNRLGIDAHETAKAIQLLKSANNIVLDGVMSHFASSDKPKLPATKLQVVRFRDIIKKITEEGLHFNFQHLANSEGIENHCFPEGNLVRAGLHLYGIGGNGLQPVAKWSAQVYQIRDLKKGDQVGYGARFTAKKKMKMAVLGVGYGDGYKRSNSNAAYVLVKGRRCKVIGSVSMDLTAIDVSSVPNISLDDRAVLLGKDGKDEITAEELAKISKTIPWEIVTSISPRVPRIIANAK